MVFTVSGFLNERQCINDLETAFHVALKQNQNLCLQIGTHTYLIHPELDRNREHRIQKWKKIYQEAQPP